MICLKISLETDLVSISHIKAETSPSRRGSKGLFSCSDLTWVQQIHFPVSGEDSDTVTALRLHTQTGEAPVHLSWLRVGRPNFTEPEDEVRVRSVCARESQRGVEGGQGRRVWISGTRESWGLKVNRQGEGEQTSRYMSGLGGRASRAGPAEVEATESKFLVGGDENKFNLLIPTGQLLHR